MGSGSLLASAAPVAAAFVALTVMEMLWPLRRTVEPKARRVARNLGVAGLSYATLSLLHVPIVTPIVALVERRQLGLLNVLALPPAAAILLGVLLLDYTLWHWHWINHRVPFFWRFHAVHHMDLDLDASTALRFHFGEMALSIGYRVLQVLLIGPSPGAVVVWQALLAVSILFHHGNLRLPLSLERVLVRLVVTPRMHGIHHSIVAAESNANYASLLSAWDVLHRTMRLDVPQGAVTIGIPSHRTPSDVTIGRILVSPFVAPPPPWRLPTGESPQRGAGGRPKHLEG